MTSALSRNGATPGDRRACPRHSLRAHHPLLRTELLADMRAQARARAEHFTFERARNAQWAFYEGRMAAHRDSLRVDVR